MGELNIAGIFPYSMDYSEHSEELGLEEHIHIIEKRIQKLAETQDIIATPDGTFRGLNPDRGPIIQIDKGGNLLGDEAILNFLQRMSVLANTTSTYLFLGSFSEEIHVEGYYVISTTAISIDPNGKFSYIRKNSHDGFMFVDENSWKKYTKEVSAGLNPKGLDYQHGTESEDPALQDAILPYIHKSNSSRVLTTSEGIKVLPLICAEIDHGMDAFKEMDVDLVIHMVCSGYRYNLEAGSIKNFDRFDHFDYVRKPMSKSAGDIALGLMQNSLEGVMQSNGALLTCDIVNKQMAIFYPFADKKVQNYDINKDGVFGIVQFN